MNPLVKASIFSFLLALFKGVIFILSGSMIVAASFVDSLVDSLMSLANYKMQRLAKQGADREHPFGHGGLEVLASLVQGLIIAFAGASIIYKSALRIFSTANEAALSLRHLDMAFAMLVISAIAGLLIQRGLAKHQQDLVARRERSLVVSADQAHYLSDFVMNLSGALGLAIVYLTEQILVDASFGLIGGLLVLKTAYPILHQSVADIMHRKLDKHDQQRIVDIAIAESPLIKGLHRLRSRRHGPLVFIDFHLKLPQDLALREAHAIGDRVTRALRKELPNLDVMIHLDPDDEPDDELFVPEYQIDAENKSQ